MPAPLSPPDGAACPLPLPRRYRKSFCGGVSALAVAQYVSPFVAGP
jgi:hypothetical protein